MAMAFGGLALSKIASALNRHRKGGRINHVSAPNARARRSRAGVVELRGRRRPPPDRRSMVMGLRRVRAVRFRAVFIPWRVAAERSIIPERAATARPMFFLRIWLAAQLAA